MRIRFEFDFVARAHLVQSKSIAGQFLFGFHFRLLLITPCTSNFAPAQWAIQAIQGQRFVPLGSLLHPLGLQRALGRPWTPDDQELLETAMPAWDQTPDRINPVPPI
jgi:hypothetical protein